MVRPVRRNTGRYARALGTSGVRLFVEAKLLKAWARHLFWFETDTFDLRQSTMRLGPQICAGQRGKARLAQERTNDDHVHERRVPSDH